MKRAMIGLIVLIPLASVVLGVVMLVLALSGPDDQMRVNQEPLSKTSWQHGE